MVDSGWRFFAELHVGTTILLISDRPESAIALAELGCLVIAVVPPSYDHCVITKFREKYRAEKKLMRKINICVASGLQVVPFRENSFALIVIEDLTTIFGKFGCQGSMQLVVEDILVDLWKYLKPEGKLFFWTQNNSLKSIIKRKKVQLFPRLVMYKLKRRKIDVSTIIDYYPSNGNLSVIRDDANWDHNFNNLKLKLKALLKSEATGLICNKSDKSRAGTTVKEIISRIDRRKGFCESTTYEMTRGSAEVFVIRMDEHIVRLPRIWRSEIVKRWSTNFEALCSLRNLSLPFKIPWPVAAGRFGNQLYSVESKLSGVTKEGRELKHEDDEKLYQAAVKSLIALFRITARIRILDEKIFKYLFGEPIDRLDPYCDENERKMLKGIKAKYKEIFLNIEFPLVRTHGDFKRSNFIFGSENQLEGIFDWDLSRPAGLPLMDLFLFMGFEAMDEMDQDFYSSIITEFIDKSPQENRILGYYLEETYWIDEAKVKFIAFLTLIYYFAYHFVGIGVDLKVMKNVKELVCRLDSLFQSESFGNRAGEHHSGFELDKAAPLLRGKL